MTGEFDRRPGDLEATRGLPRQARDERARIYAIGARGEQGWRVHLMQGGVVIADLSAGEAVALSGEMIDLGGLIEGGYKG